MYNNTQHEKKQAIYQKKWTEGSIKIKTIKQSWFWPRSVAATREHYQSAISSQMSKRQAKHFTEHMNLWYQ